MKRNYINQRNQSENIYINYRIFISNIYLVEVNMPHE